MKNKILFQLIFVLMICLIISMCTFFLIEQGDLLFDDTDGVVQEMDLDSFVAATTSALVFVLCLFFMSRKHISYISEITAGIQLMSAGNLNQKIEVKGDNELSILVSEINQMSSALEEKIQSEREHDLQQRKLISNMSHDLRTPLTSLIGYLTLLNNGKMTKEEHDKYLSIAYNKSKRLERLIDDLFVYTKLVNNEISIALVSVDILSFVKQYLAENPDFFDSKGLHVDFYSKENSYPVYVDINQTLRVLENIFSNISKYAIDHSTVAIEIIKSEEDISLTFTNISNNDLDGVGDKVFNRLYTCDESRQDESSGLGLSIVKEIMQKQAGEVYCRWEKPHFSITLVFKTCHY